MRRFGSRLMRPTRVARGAVVRAGDVVAAAEAENLGRTTAGSLGLRGRKGQLVPRFELWLGSGLHHSQSSKVPFLVSLLAHHEEDRWENTQEAAIEQKRFRRASPERLHPRGAREDVL